MKYTFLILGIGCLLTMIGVRLHRYDSPDFAKTVITVGLSFQVVGFVDMFLSRVKKYLLKKSKKKESMKSIEVPFKGDAFTRQALIVESRELKVKVRELPKGLDGMPDFSKASPELQAAINDYVTKVAAFGWLPEEREEPVSLQPLFSSEAAPEYPA